MSISLLISVLGALSAIIVSLLGAWFANRNNIILQTRKLKEEHYIAYLEALHYLAASEDTDREATKRYVLTRDKLFLIAAESVIMAMLAYENKGVGQPDEIHDLYLTNLIKVIRKDLKIIDTNFPIIQLKK